MEYVHSMKTKKFPKGWKIVIQGLPLAGAAVTPFLPLQRQGQQFAMLVVLIWIQLFFIFDIFQTGK
jgi:hypothetical protein